MRRQLGVVRVQPRARPQSKSQRLQRRPIGSWCLFGGQARNRAARRIPSSRAAWAAVQRLLRCSNARGLSADLSLLGTRLARLAPGRTLAGWRYSGRLTCSSARFETESMSLNARRSPYG